MEEKKIRPVRRIVRIGDIAIGGESIVIIAGPCTIENEKQLKVTAKTVQKSGACILRGGTFKVRTSPHSFQGLGTEGLNYLIQTGRDLKMPVASEIIDTAQISQFEEVDLIQIGARSMQNVALLKTVGKMGKPVLLKRGFSATIEELLFAAEYLIMSGCEDIVLCERGIRTFETATRNTLDLSAIPLLKEKTPFPVIVDPSHATGHARLVPPMCFAAIAAGADGLMIEVHPSPAKALCDGMQALTPEAFDSMMPQLKNIAVCMGRII